MLHRALRPVQQGFYVDVGANDPVCHSITKAFYERGWRGINIEPVQSWFGKIEADRSRDEGLPLFAKKLLMRLSYIVLPSSRPNGIRGGPLA